MPHLTLRPADAEVLQAAAHDEHLVAAGSGRMNPDALRVVQQARVGREPEEEVLLLGPLAGPLVVGHTLPGCFSSSSSLNASQRGQYQPAYLPRRSPAAVGALAPTSRAQSPSTPRLWTLVGGADEAVVADVEALPQLRGTARDLVAVLLLRDAPLAGDALDVLAVLVGAGQQERVVARSARRAERVGRDRV